MNDCLRSFIGEQYYTVPDCLKRYMEAPECQIVATWYILITQSIHRHVSLFNIRSKLAASCPWEKIGTMLEKVFNLNNLPGSTILQLGAIGKGNMSVVLSHRNGLLIAVKQQLFHRGQWEVSSHMIHECLALAGVSHKTWAPSIIYQHVSRDMLQIGMEYIPLSMKQMIRLCNRDVVFIRNMMRQLVSAVYELHQMGYAHRDIKPDNIRFRSNGSLVLIDYDSCELYEGQHTYKTNHVCTTPYRDPYLFPPDVDLSAYSYKYLDAFSCGSVFLYMLLGAKDAFTGNDEVEIFESMQYKLNNVTGHIQSSVVNKLQKMDVYLLEGLLHQCPDKRLSINDAYNALQNRPEVP
jgi:serine/threonine protein kinase